VGPPWVIITDLDRTFLGAQDYDYEPLRPAVRALKRWRIPIVFCTSKTRAEVEELRRDLAIRDPFIVENGGAVYVGRRYFPFPVDGASVRGHYLAVEQGVSYRALAEALDRTEQETGCEIERFGKMSVSDVAHVTALPRSKARLAKAREFDEPFRFVTASPSKRAAFLRRLRRCPGIRVTRGGRFFHATGLGDKGLAVRTIKSLFRRLRRSVRFVGLGDSPNDLPMLRSVDVPILLRGPDGRYDRSITAALPTVLRSPAAAPLGWMAVLSIVRPGARLQRTGDRTPSGLV